MPQVTVKHRFIHQAPRKLRLVSDMVRGLPTDQAMAELATLPKAASEVVRKLILAGIAAARQQGLDANSLFVGQIMVDEGPGLRRFIPLGRGRSQRVEKTMSHVTVTITDEPVKIASSKVYKRELSVAQPARRQSTKTKKSEKAAEQPAEPVIEAPADAAVEAAEGSK